MSHRHTIHTKQHTYKEFLENQTYNDYDLSKIKKNRFTCIYNIYNKNIVNSQPE